MSRNFLDKNFIRHRNNLISNARGWNIPYEDIEEIVNDTILKALENFDNEKGSFECYCRLILKNKIINFKTGNKDLFLLITIDDNEDILPADIQSFEKKENNLLALKFLEKLKHRLADDEVILFNEIYKSCENPDKINISKASRVIGIDPERGWEIFRKIQRKANNLYKDLISKGDDIGFISEKGSIVCETGFEDVRNMLFYEPEIQLQKDVSAIDGSDKFLLSLNEIQISKLKSLYSNSSV